MPGRRGMFRPLTHNAMGTATANPSGEALVNGTIGWLGFRDCIDGTANTIMMGENGFTQQRRELIGNVMAISNALNAAAAPAIADQVRDPNRQNYYVADGTGIAVSLKIGVGGENVGWQFKTTFSIPSCHRMDPMSAQPTPTTTAITTSCLPLPATIKVVVTC